MGIFCCHHFNSPQSSTSHCPRVTMKVSTFVFSLLIILLVKKNVSARIVAVSKQCNEVYSKTSYQYVPYEETYETRNWLGARKYKTRINYRYQSVITNHTRPTCCVGFTEYGSLCRPFCSKNCGENGYCAFPEHCACEHGYTMDLQVDKCRPICMDECFNGYCAAPDTCECKDGYDVVNGTCAPICASCDVNESCAEPHVCRCNDGYSRVPHSRLDSEATEQCHPVCNRPCVNGACVRPNVCRCNDGYGDYDGDEFTCEPRCRAKCVHGECTAPDVCTCHDGFKLRPNSTHVCEPFCPQECVNAACTAPGKCSCLDGYLSTDEKHKCEPHCPSGCEHGRCVAPEQCACDDGYEPQPLSPRCAPVCTEGCHMGECVAPNTCKCYEGYNLTNGSVSECVPSCKDDCTHGTCTAPDVCTCDDGYEKAPSNSTDGSAKCIVICECENGYCSDTNSTCQSCLEGYELFVEGNATSCKPRCEGGCENGQCVEPQKCECDEYYVADNDTLGNPICAHACGGECAHGSCSVDSGLCSCLYGWVGKHCEEPSVCSVAVANRSFHLLFNGSSGFEENENVTEIEEPWTGPMCNNLCAGEINNTSVCANQSNGERPIFVCFVDINSPCNSYRVVQANTATAKVNYTILTTSIVILLLVVTAITIGMFIRKKRLEKSTEINKSKQSSQRVEEDNLIENENDGISL